MEVNVFELLIIFFAVWVVSMVGLTEFQAEDAVEAEAKSGNLV